MNGFCDICERFVDTGCTKCEHYDSAFEDHEDDWYNETHEDAEFWDDFEGGIFFDDEKEGDES